MTGKPAQGDDDDADVESLPVAPGHNTHRLVSVALLAVAACCFVGVVAVRQGPSDGQDTTPLTAVTTAVADGDLRVAASVTALPDPPGYPLLAAPLVALLRGSVGAPAWCIPSDRVGSPGPDHSQKWHARLLPGCRSAA